MFLKFYFKLEPWQKEKIDMFLNMAKIDAMNDKNGSGAVFAQIGDTSDGDGSIIVHGGYLPKAYAEQIKTIIEKYYGEISILML